MEEMKLVIRIIGEYGLPIALVVFFIWRDWKREKDMTLRIRTLEDEVRTIYRELVERVLNVITTNSETMRSSITVFSSRPCLADELAKNALAELMKRNEKHFTDFKKKEG